MMSQSYGAEIKVGLYEEGAGSKGLYESLKNDPSLRVTIIKSSELGFQTLAANDVFIIGSVKSIGESAQEAIRRYVSCGGGTLIHHFSIGLETPLFPAIGKNKTQYNNTLLFPNGQQPVLKDIPKQFDHAFGDHWAIELKTDSQAQIFIKDKFGLPVVVASDEGFGRVILNGCATGLGQTGESEKAPTGAEKQLLLNSIKWLAEVKLTSLDKSEFDKRLAKVDEAQLHVKYKEYEAREKEEAKWFNEDLLRCVALERPPVNSLGGRYFAIIRQDYLNNFGYLRTKQYMHQLKLIGITDIIQLNIRSAKVYFPTANSDAIGAPAVGAYDPLMLLVRIASEEGIKVWVKLQMAQTGGLLPEKMQALDQNGKKITYQGGDVPDFLGSDYRRFLHQMIDEFAARYNQYGNFAGIFTDMLWENTGDYHWNHLAVFDQFCFRNFGEHLPEDIKTKMSKERKWVAPEDKWWRRMVLFRQWANEDFHRDLGDYLHEKGFKLGIQIYDFTSYGVCYCVGMHPYRWHLLGDFTWDYAGKEYNELNVYENNLAGYHIGGDYPGANTGDFHGQMGGESFNFENIWRPVLFGSTPRIYEEYKRNIVNVREWAGGTSLARTAFLHNVNGLILRLGDKSGGERNKYLSLFKTLSYFQDVSSIYVEDADLYRKFRVLIAAPHSTSGLSKENMDALKKYISEGGTVISLNAKWSTSLPDLSDEKDMTLEMSGAEYVQTGAGGMSGADFPVRENMIGKGRVITIPIADFASAVQKDTDIAKAFSALVKKYAAPEIIMVGAKIQNNVKVRIINTLKKNNWIGIALLSDDFKPATTRLSVDVEKLGLGCASGYRVFLLGRKMELLRPGDFAGGTLGKGVFWTKDDFKNGFDISILRDNEADLKVPEGRSIDVSQYPPYWQSRIGSYLDRNWSKYKATRSYEHEIVVIAPADELTIDGKKIAE